jgi:lysophospholipase L1-like esterase
VWPRVEALLKSEMARTGASVAAVLLAIGLAGAFSSPVLAKGKKRAKKTPVVLATVSASASAAPVSSASAAPSVSASAASVINQPAIAKLTINKGTKVLVFGDSMVDAGFAQRLQKLVEARGATLVHDAWTSSSTTSWSKGDRLDNLLVVHRPDVVIVALGANEVFLPAPEAVAGRVRTIVNKLAPRPCIWVSPPLWKGETGIVGVERNNSAPCGFYDSGAVKVERAKDGIHPTPKGGSDWADAVFAAVVE